MLLHFGEASRNVCHASDIRVLLVVPGSGSVSSFVAKKLWALFGLWCVEITLAGNLRFLRVLNEYGAPL